MSDLISHPSRFRRLVAGSCLIAAPLILLVGALIHPRGEATSAAHLAVVAVNPDRYYWAHAILLVGLALFLPLVLALMHLLRDRGPKFAHVGGALAIVGLFGATAIVAVDGIAVSQMAQPQANVDEMAGLLDRIMGSPGTRAIAVVAGVGSLLGMLILAYGIRQTRSASLMVSAGAAAGAIAFFVGVATDQQLVFALAFVVYLLAFGPLGWHVLRESDDEWARGGIGRRAKAEGLEPGT